ncbi:MAG: ABC transporter permease [Clostridiales bacterium]|jgi:oligopeptide transport system permease protein|uniref:ABC transporter permease n=1 Tax=Chordicoccus furentiruminis TaxID=2709410 RepID=UPI0023A84506|nr:ABC transporter permease [Chordicoccus furentiruminis]MCI6173849.1 ABC transporter permease [Clostridiales bacterium]
MAKYIVKRVILAIVSILVICMITFFAMNAVPGGPFNSEKALSPATKKALEARYNLDKPVPEQFIIYMKGILHGDFGVSLKTGRDISTTIRNCFGVSATIGGLAALFAVIIGIILGALAALFRNRWPDRVIIFFTTLFTAMPSFVFATFLLMIFCIQLKVLPVWDASSRSLILPVISLAAYPTAYITRLTKTSMLDVLGQDYIRTARAKGVPTVRVIFKHALRNALIPVITYVGPMLASILTGSLVVENIFTIGGLGQQFVQSISNRDYPMIMATTIFLAVIMIVMNLLSDILYKVVDPRITLD